MNTIAHKITEGRVLVSDGAWGTFLHKKGLKPGECPELWNIERSNDVLEIAQSYIDAGSNMIETNSFGGSSFKLAPYGLADRVKEINIAAARISRQAAGANRHVLGSIGPTGKMIIMGEVTHEELYAAFKEQAMALAEGGADALVIETMSDLDEVRAAVLACQENTQCEIICTMTFEKSGEGQYNSMMGVTPAQMAEELAAMGVPIIGANCGNGTADMIGVVKEIRSVNSSIPILIHANAGAPIYKQGETVFPETPLDMAKHIEALISSGANIIGGCCGTTPDHIRQIVATLRKK